MTAQMTAAYDDYYRARNPVHVYPVEFVVRALLGTYPRRKSDRSAYPGKFVLDLGFGDGRNMPLLHNLGMRISGVEISQEICDLTTARMRELQVPVSIKVGRNSSIPFGDSEFDYVLACHSCYYVDHGNMFSDNLAEIFRVLKPGGTFIGSVPITTGYNVRDGRYIGGGHVVVTNDPLQLRNGIIMRAFRDEAEIKSEFSRFEDFQIGHYKSDFWGIEEHEWIVVCKKS